VYTGGAGGGGGGGGGDRQSVSPVVEGNGQGLAGSD